MTMLYDYKVPILLATTALFVLMGGACTPRLPSPPTAPAPGETSEQPAATPTTPATNETPALPSVTGPALDLSNQGLTKLPAYVLERTDLAALDISYNKLTGALPGEIRFLKNLTTLNASYNQMTGVPAEIGQLTKLTELNLANNQLTGLPYELGNLINLKRLVLTGNNYSEQDLEVILRGIPNVEVVR